MSRLFRFAPTLTMGVLAMGALAGLFAVTTTPGPAHSQAQGQTPEGQITADERRNVLRQVAGELREGYIYPDKGRAMATDIERAAKDDRFKDARQLADFVHSANAYLLELSDDRHLRLIHGDLPQEGPKRRIGPGGGRPDRGPDGQRVIRQSAADRAVSHGFIEARVLDGNLGYLDLRGFSGDPSSKATADEMMLELADTEALILDLRRNGGGGPFMVRYLSGFLFAEPTHLASTFMRGWDEPRERWSLYEGRPTDAFVDKPVYVLTSRRTFSAAESFTFGLKINRRITIVGERTGGGGHFGRTVPVGAGLRVFLPHGRTYDPKTGQGWEAEGIVPDIEVPADEALETAVRASKTRVSTPVGIL